MTFKKGQGGGAPKGNTNAAKGRRWAHAIERALEAYPKRAISLSVNQGMDNAAYEYVHKLMLEKDIAFFRELGDRIDGKAAQQVQLTGDEENPVQTVTRIELVDLGNDDSSSGSASE